MTRLPLPLKEHLRDPVDEGALQRMAQEIDARAPTCRRRRWAIPLAATMAAVTAAGAFVLFPRAPGPLLLADGSAVVAVDAGPMTKDLALSDGSRIRLARGARLEPLASSGVVFSAIVTRGRAEFEVRPGGPRIWTIECGLATIEVLGTAFSCERGPNRLRVTVSRGAVLVRGERVPDRARRLLAGQTLDVIADPQRPWSLVPSMPGAVEQKPNAALSSGDGRPPPIAPRGGTSAPPARSSKAWRALARHGRHGEAFAVLGTDGLRRESKRLGVDDLLALADVARLSGHPAEAVAPLERILVEFAGDAHAPLAAFALGRLELDSLARPQAAARALERALALGIPRGLREDVRARLVEAHARDGNLAAARAAAKSYAEEFPRGRHARAIEGWLRPR